MIEGHLHLGKDLVFDGRDTTEQMILDILRQNNIDRCVLFPANSNISVEVEREKHKEVLEACSKYPTVFYGICQVNPHYEGDQYFNEVRRYIEQGFKGVAVNPQIYGWDPMSVKGEKVFEAARKLEIPLFVNVGVGLPFGQPIRLLELCEKYRDVKVVMMHVGRSVCGSQCAMIADHCPNVYLETSLGSNMRQIKSYVNKYGAQRVIMGSCMINEVSHSIYTYRNCGLSSDEFEWATSKTILSVLGIEEVQQ